MRVYSTISYIYNGILYQNNKKNLAVVENIKIIVFHVLDENVLYSWMLFHCWKLYFSSMEKLLFTITITF